MTNAQGPVEQEMCRCDQAKITKSGAIPVRDLGFIHMLKECGKPLPQETLLRLGLA